MDKAGHKTEMLWRAASELQHHKKDPLWRLLQLYTQQPALHKPAGDQQPQQYHHLCNKVWPFQEFFVEHHQCQLDVHQDFYLLNQSIQATKGAATQTTALPLLLNEMIIATSKERFKKPVS